MSETIKWADLTELQRSALVAEKVLGWQWIAYDYHDSSMKGQLWLLPDGESVTNLRPGEWTSYLEEEQIYPDGSPFPLPRQDNRHLPVWLPHYSTNIEDAWEVVEHMKKRASMIYLPDLDSQIAQASIWANSEFHLGCATTMPEAICIAALKAVGLQVET